MNRKGQALIEFVLILPVFLLILMVIVDFGNIFRLEYEMENQSTDIARMIQNGDDIDKILAIYSKLDVKVSDYKEDYKKITVTKSVDLMAPLIDRILGDPYIINVERIIPNEEA